MLQNGRIFTFNLLWSMLMKFYRGTHSFPATKLRYSSRVKSLGSEFSSILTRRIDPFTSSSLNGGGSLLLLRILLYSGFIMTTSRSGHWPMKVGLPESKRNISFFRGSMSKSICLMSPNCSLMSTATVILNSYDKKIFAECKWTTLRRVLGLL